jgi:hypothetical protein
MILRAKRHLTQELADGAFHGRVSVCTVQQQVSKPDDNQPECLQPGEIPCSLSTSIKN